VTPDERERLREVAHAQNEADGCEPIRDPGVLLLVAKLLHRYRMRGDQHAPNP